MNDFEKYWKQYGELHASMCNGNIKQFAKEIWQSASGKGNGFPIEDAKTDKYTLVSDEQRKLFDVIGEPRAAYHAMVKELK